MDVFGLGALALVSLEWLSLGWLSGLTWPTAGQTVPPALRVALREDERRTVSPEPPPTPTAAAHAARCDTRPNLAELAATWAIRGLSGAFLVGLAQLLVALAGLVFLRVGIVLAVAAVLAVLLRGLLSLGAQPPSAAPPRTDPATTFERVGWIALSVLLLATFVRTLLVPESGWDAYSHWGLKAQAYALSGTIVDAGTVHEYYPPLVPLLEAYLYLHRGAPDIQLGKDIWPLFGAGFGLILAAHLRSMLARPSLAPWFAAGIVLATTQFVEDLGSGQADVALTVFLSLATLAVLQYQRLPGRTWLVQAGLFAAAAALSKYEGLPRVAVVCAALVVETLLQRRARFLRAALAMVLGGGAAGLVWTIFQSTHHLTGNSEHLGAPQTAALSTMLLTLGAVLAGVRTGGGVLVAVLAAVVAGRRLFETPLRLLTLVVLGQVGATLVAFLINDTPADVEVRTAATRLIEQFLPVALFGSAMWLSAAMPMRKCDL